MKGLKTIQEDQMIENEIFCQLGHQKGPREPLVAPFWSYLASKTHWWGQWEPILTLEVGQQSKLRGCRPFRRTKWSENEIFGQIGHQNPPYDPLPTPGESYQVSRNRSEGLWEPILTLEARQQSKWRGWRPFRRTKWLKNEVFGQIGIQNGPLGPLATPCGWYQVP